jgi:hypothetical protein
MKKFLKKWGRKATTVPIFPEEDIEKKLIAEMSEKCIVIPPMGTLTAVDVPIIQNVCEKYNAISLGFVDGALPTTALFAHRDDVEYMGFLTADYAGKILFQNISPKDLPIFYIKSDRFRKLIFNHEQMIKHGIAPLEDDVLATLHDNAHRAHLPFYNFAVIDRFGAIQGLRLCQGMKHASRAHEEQATYNLRHIVGDPYDDGYMREMIAQAHQQFFNGIITYTSEDFKAVQQKMLATKEFIPILHIGVGDIDRQEPELTRTTYHRAFKALLMLLIATSHHMVESLFTMAQRYEPRNANVQNVPNIEFCEGRLT